MEQKILTSTSASDLNLQIKNMIEEGWTPVGSHQVVEKHHQPKYAGTQLMQIVITHTYSQTVRKD